MWGWHLDSFNENDYSSFNDDHGWTSAFDELNLSPERKSDGGFSRCFSVRHHDENAIDKVTGGMRSFIEQKCIVEMNGVEKEHIVGNRELTVGANADQRL